MLKAMLIAACLCGAATVPRAAYACSGVISCPRSLTVPPSGGRLPANMQMFLWRLPCRADVSDARPVLEATTPGASKRVEEMHVEPAAESIGGHRFVVRWDEPFDPGTELLFSFDEPVDLEVPDKDAGAPELQRRAVEIRVGEPAERREQLGWILPTRAFGAFALASGEGDCSHFVQGAYVDLQVVEPLADAPWADAYVYETRVDDQRWSPYRTSSLQGESDSWIGGSSLGRNRDRVHLPCALPGHPLWLFESLKKDLAPGKHSARIVGFLPDGSEISSPSYTFTLECPAEIPDAGITEFLSPEWVEQEKRDASVAARAADGGGCDIAAHGGNAPLWLLSLLALLRRRRRSGCEDLR